MCGWLGAVMELPHEDEELTGIIEGLRQGFTIYLADGIPAEGLPLAMELAEQSRLSKKRKDHLDQIYAFVDGWESPEY